MCRLQPPSPCLTHWASVLESRAPGGRARNQRRPPGSATEHPSSPPLPVRSCDAVRKPGTPATNNRPSQLRSGMVPYRCGGRRLPSRSQGSTAKPAPPSADGGGARIECRWSPLRRRRSRRHGPVTNDGAIPPAAVSVAACTRTSGENALSGIPWATVRLRSVPCGQATHRVAGAPGFSAPTQAPAADGIVLRQPERSTFPIGSQPQGQALS